MKYIREHLTRHVVFPVIVSLLVSGVGWAFVLNKSDAVQETKIENLQRQLDRIEKNTDYLRERVDKLYGKAD